MSAAGRRRNNIRQYSAEGEALNQISKEAEDRLAAKRAARAEAREIRQREMEKKMKEQEMMEGNGESTPEPPTPKAGRHGGRPGRTNATKSYREEEPEDVPLRDRDFKSEFRELEEKYKAAMMSVAQLDNEKTALNYSVDLLKEDLEEREECGMELQRQLKEKTRDLEFARRDFKDCERQLEQMKEILSCQTKLMEESGFMVVRDEEGKMVLEKTSTALNGPISGSVLLTSETLGLLPKEEGTLGTATNNRPTCSRATQTPSHFALTEGTEVPDGEQSPCAASPSLVEASGSPAIKPDCQRDQVPLVDAPSANLLGSNEQSTSKPSKDGEAAEVPLHEEVETRAGVEALVCPADDEPDGSGGVSSSGEKAGEGSLSIREQMVLDVGSEGAMNREDSGISSPDAITTSVESSAQGVLLSSSVECDANRTGDKTNPAVPSSTAEHQSDDEEFFDACSSPLPSPRDGDQFENSGSTKSEENVSKVAQDPGAEGGTDRLDLSAVDLEGSSVDGPEFSPKAKNDEDDRQKASASETVEKPQTPPPQKKGKKKRKKKKKQKNDKVEKDPEPEDDAPSASKEEMERDDEKPASGDEGSRELEPDSSDEAKLEASVSSATAEESAMKSSVQEEERQLGESAEIPVASTESQQQDQEADVTGSQDVQGKETADTTKESVPESQDTKADSTAEEKTGENEDDLQICFEVPSETVGSEADQERSENAVSSIETRTEETDEALTGGEGVVELDTRDGSDELEQMGRKGSQKRKPEGFDRTFSEGTLPQDKKMKVDEAGQSDEALDEMYEPAEQDKAEGGVQADGGDLLVRFEAGEDQTEEGETEVSSESRPCAGSVESENSSPTSEEKGSKETTSTEMTPESTAVSPAESKLEESNEAQSSNEKGEPTEECQDKTEDEKLESEEQEDKYDVKKEDKDGKDVEKLNTSHDETASEEGVQQEEKVEEKEQVEDKEDNTLQKEDDEDQKVEGKPEHSDEDPTKASSHDKEVEGSPQEGGDLEAEKEKTETADAGAPLEKSAQEGDDHEAEKEEKETTDAAAPSQEMAQEGDDLETEKEQNGTTDKTAPLQKTLSQDHSEDGGGIDEYDFDDIDEVLETGSPSGQDPGSAGSQEQQDRASNLSSPSIDTLDTLDTTSTHSAVSTDRLDTGSMGSLLSSSDDKPGEEAGATPSKTTEKSEHGKHGKKKGKGEKSDKAEKSSKGNPLGSFKKSKKGKGEGSQTPGEHSEKGAEAGAAAEHHEKHEKDKKKGFFKNLFK